MTLSKEEILKRIKKSREKYLQRRTETKQYQQTLKEGRKFLRDNKLEGNVFTHEFFFDILLSFCYKLESDKLIKYSFCIKSERDQFSPKIEKGLLGNRLSKEECFTVTTKKKLNKKGIQNLILADFLTTVLSSSIFDEKIPQKLLNAIRQQQTLIYLV